MRDKTFVLAIAAAIMLLLLSGPAAELRAQNPQDDRDKLYVPDQDYIQAPMPPGDEKYARIDPAALKQSEADIVAISEKSRTDGNQFWGRVTGTPYDRMTSDYMMGRFQELGLEQVRRGIRSPPQWLPQSWDADLEANGKSTPLTSAYPISFSLGTGAAPLEADVVWVGLGTAADFMGRDVAGKAVMIETWPTPGGLSHSAAWNGAINRALKSGASMAFIVNAFPGKVDAPYSMLRMGARQLRGSGANYDSGNGAGQPGRLVRA